MRVVCCVSLRYVIIVVDVCLWVDYMCVAILNKAASSRVRYDDFGYGMARDM